MSGSTMPVFGAVANPGVNLTGITPGATTQLTPMEMSTIGQSTGIQTPDTGLGTTVMDGIESMYKTDGKIDFSKGLDTIGKLGNAYYMNKDQQMKQKQFDSNEKFREWLKQKEEERSAGAKSLGKQLAR